MPAAGTPADLGMLIFQPVYRPGAPIETVRQRRGALRGFVVETLNLDALIRGALPDLEREGLEFRLVDATGTLSEKTIVASTRAGAATSSPLRFAMWMTVQDRQWRLELYAAPGYLAARRGEGGWLVLGSGLLLTIILGAYLLASARHTAEVSRLAEGLRKISRAVEYSPASVLITDTQGAIEYVNPKFTQVTGYSLEEVRGQNPRLLRSGEMPPEAYQRLWATITAGGEWRGEFHNRKKTGELFWEAASISPVRGSDGRITHYVAVKEDITEQKRIEEAAEIRTRQLEAIRAVTAEITRELDLHTLLSLITQRATELADAVSGGIYLWNDADQVLVPHAYYGAGWLRERFPRRLGEGLMGYVAQERRGVIVNDYRRWPLAHQRTLETTEITAVLAEPLVYRDRLLGVIAVQHHRGERTFDAADQDVLRLFAVQAAIAIENVRLYEAAIERGAELEALVSATRSVTSGLNLQEILDRILNEAARISGAPHVKVLLLDKTAGVLRVGALRGSAMPPTFALPVGLGSSGLVAKTGQPLYMADAQNDPRSLFATRDRELGIVTYLGLPIKRGDDVLGVLTFNTTVPRRYRPEELTFLTAFADQAAIAIENARLYERVRDHAATLEQQVRERTRDLEAALQLAEAASRAKAEFLTNMSHELRTPLNGILGFSELLLRQGQTFPRDKQDRFLRNIHTSGQRLFELVSQLLDCTTVEAGGLALDRRSVVPASALDEVVTEIRPLATRKGLVLRVEIAPDLPPMHADPVRFRQICSNLFTNAIKFTASGGMITIAARAVTGPSGDPAVERPGSDPSRPGAQVLSGPPAEWLELSVTDTGMGIRAEDMPRLFQQFTLLESVYTKRNAGSGIGLALTKRLVDLHGGRIWVESDGEGKGSTFRVVLPIADPAATRGPLDRDSGDRSPDCAESDGNADAVWNTDRTGQQREKGKR